MKILKLHNFISFSSFSLIEVHVEFAFETSRNGQINAKYIHDPFDLHYYKVCTKNPVCVEMSIPSPETECIEYMTILNMHMMQWK